MSTPKRTDIRLANEAWEAVMTVHATMLSHFTAEGVFGELSMREYDVLYTLAKHETPMRLGEMQSGVLLSQPALSRLVDRLVARGLVERCADREDRRALQISLTPTGKAIQQEVGRRHARGIARDLGAALKPEEIAELGRLATKLAAGPTTH